MNCDGGLQQTMWVITLTFSLVLSLFNLTVCLKPVWLSPCLFFFLVWLFNQRNLLSKCNVVISSWICKIRFELHNWNCFNLMDCIHVALSSQQPLKVSIYSFNYTGERPCKVPTFISGEITIHTHRQHSHKGAISYLSRLQHADSKELNHQPSG